jgi:hypothetical protein
VLCKCAFARVRVRKNNLKKRLVCIVGGAAAREETGGAVRGCGLGCVVRDPFFF